LKKESQDQEVVSVSTGAKNTPRAVERAPTEEKRTWRDRMRSLLSLRRGYATSAEAFAALAPLAQQAAEAAAHREELLRSMWITPWPSLHGGLRLALAVGPHGLEPLRRGDRLLEDQSFRIQAYCSCGWHSAVYDCPPDCAWSPEDGLLLSPEVTNHLRDLWLTHCKAERSTISLWHVPRS
jgi:hypothetical protein